MHDINYMKSYKVLHALVEIAFILSLVAFGAVTLILIFTRGSSFTLNYGDILNIQIPSSDGKGYLATLLGLLGGYGIGTFILFNVRSVVRSVKHSSPFIEKNVQRIRYISIALFIQSYVLMIAGFLASQVQEQILADLGFIPESTASISLLPTGVVVALCVFVFAEVFRYGCDLQQSYDDTV